MSLYAWLAIACAGFLLLQVWDYRRRPAEYQQEKRNSYIIRAVLLALAMVLNLVAWLTE